MLHARLIVLSEALRLLRFMPSFGEEKSSLIDLILELPRSSPICRPGEDAKFIFLLGVALDMPLMALICHGCVGMRP